mmetsp:Transcript_84456/g.219861  ORF Transcript_84456/g.219861 Transcript_84456/m.219861 type:complete len:152 (-) Transcript_84456:556-1011(-)
MANAPAIKPTMTGVELPPPPDAPLSGAAPTPTTVAIERSIESPMRVEVVAAVVVTRGGKVGASVGASVAETTMGAAITTGGGAGIGGSVGIGGNVGIGVNVIGSGNGGNVSGGGAGVVGGIVGGGGIGGMVGNSVVVIVGASPTMGASPFG